MDAKTIGLVTWVVDGSSDEVSCRLRVSRDILVMEMLSLAVSRNSQFVLVGLSPTGERREVAARWVLNTKS